MKQRKISKVSILVIASTLFCVFGIWKFVFAKPVIHEISNFDELVEAATLSRQQDYQKDTYILKNDIEITQEDQKKLNESEFKYISFGSSECPFAGTFDGEGHYIKNLKYESSLAVKADTGLFAYTTKGAIIKNLEITNADIQADYRGGLVVGYAEETLFENISIRDSHLFVAATDNVLTLITDGGLRGGAIVGEAKNCKIYNCESINNFINTNNTSGVAALSGKGLYLGGLVGTSITTEVEYSRVIGGTVKNYYDVAVGALGGNTLYVGGIVGQMKSASKVIDSFSTAELNFYCATYVSVGAGNVGHIGGITGAMFGDANEIQRSHYAGKATSKQYNAVLVIPVIQNNINISGITDVFEGGVVLNSYFKPSVNPKVEMKVLGSKTITSAYGPLSDERYIDRDYWTTQNYDFFGTLKRQTDYNENHINKWVMDYEKGIPVHGNSIASTFDFPNSGEVTISKTNLINTEVTTDNAYKFAIQGLAPNEEEISISAKEKEGYKFQAWYKLKNSTVYEIKDNHEFFRKVFEENEPISINMDFHDTQVKNNDLYIALYKAKVTFSDIEGNEINIKNGEPSANSEQDDNNWYTYEEKLPEVIPVNKPDSKNAKLIGWTTIKSNEEGGGYSKITSSQLTEIKSKDKFFETGDKITKTLKLYPIYADLISNIHTIFEGNEQDNNKNEAMREGVGDTSTTLNEDGSITIKVQGVGENKSFPEGYRFLGWYNEDNIRITNEQEYTLKDIDLSMEHTYTAKFEYRIEYYIRAFAQSGGNEFTESEIFAERWQKYNTNFENLLAPGYIRETITHWGKEHINHGGTDNKNDAYEGKIVEPLKVYSHNYEDATGDSTPYHVLVTTDFPGSGSIRDEKRTSGGKFRFNPTSDRYHLQFWTLERKREGWTYIENPMNTGILDSAVLYKGMAMVTTDVIFHKKNNEEIKVIRRYQNKLFMQEDEQYTYKYPFMHQNDDVSTNPEDGKAGSLNKTVTLNASPSDESMQIEGYAFMGWISSLDVKENSTEWKKIYNVSDDSYCTSNIENVRAYLLTGEERITQTCDIYPVYAKYNIETTTNISHGNLDETINVPENPKYVMNKEEAGRATVILTIDTNTYVIGNSGEKYKLISVTYSINGQEEKTLEPDKDGKYTLKIDAGKKYLFKANYEPLLLVYHLNSTEKKVIVKNKFEQIGEMPDPIYKVGDNYVALGWTNQKPISNGYHTFKNYEEFKNSNINLSTSSMAVEKSMELWPVYIEMQIKVNSNIDQYLTTNDIKLDTIRYITKPDIDKAQLNAKNEKIKGDYEFIGWYKNYKNENDKGQLITLNNTYTLEVKECISNDIYTAVYQKVYKVSYHNTNGDIIYSINIKQDNNRTFVHQIKDEQGNNIISPIDVEAYSEIYKTLKNNEIFQNWQWQKTDGTIVKWEDFSKKTISNTMDLYPIVRRISAKDSNGNEIKVNQINENESKMIFISEKDTVSAYLTTEYNQPNLTIHVEDVSYKENGNSDTEYIKDMNIKVYPSTEIKEKTIGEDKTNKDGDAQIYFYGEITINQQAKDNNNDVFIYQVIDKDNNVVNEIVIGKDENKTIKVPYGSYTIKKKNNWAWRYKNSKEAINVNNKNIKANMAFNEDRITNKWFDHMTYIDNQY